MSRPKGTPKTGGRKLGSANKFNHEQSDKIRVLCETYNLDPIEALLKLAADENIELNLRVSILKELAQYIYPKRKTVELSAEIEMSTAPQIQIYLPDNGTSGH